jgi:hypothetical protein
LYNPSRAGPADLHPVYPDIIHFLNYPGILVFSGGEKDHTFINRIQEVMQKYKFEPVEKLMEQPKSKEE